MQIVHNIPSLRETIRQWRQQGESVALVPTMGALHDGHLSLLAAARRSADRAIASIFVNPTQFAAGEDLERYPRQAEADARALAAAGCDLLFLPDVEAIYPSGFATSIHVGAISTPMEGRLRPGHFDGVATIVAKLLLMTLPDIAIFGEKDWQQLAVIRRLVADLNIPVTISGAPIIRESDGLAMSSRNRYLSARERSPAAALPRALSQAAQAIARGGNVSTSLEAARQQLRAAGFEIDYLLLADGNDLQELQQSAPDARLFVAAKLGQTRLIDNMPVHNAPAIYQGRP